MTLVYRYLGYISFLGCFFFYYWKTNDKRYSRVLMNYIVLDIVLSNSLSSKYQTYIMEKEESKKEAFWS